MRSLLAAVLAVVLATAQPGADPISEGQWYHRFLDTARAHQLTRGEGVTVAVIDSGVDAGHPDLAGSVLEGTDLTEPGGGNGHIDDHGHGTAMASLIAAHGRVKGVAPAAKILPVRVSEKEGSRSSHLALGVRWAARNGAKVISISLGGQEDLLGRQEVQAALAADIVVVAAAGNRPDDTAVMYPAAIPGVVAAVAVDSNGDRADLSVSGEQVVIAAPGVDISTARPRAQHNVGSGTSDATAITAGAVALIRSRFPQLKAPEVVQRLTATATDRGQPGRDRDYGFGVIDLVAALTADIPGAPTASAGSPDARLALRPPSEPEPLTWWWRGVLLLVAVQLGAGCAIGAALWARR